MKCGLHLKVLARNLGLVFDFVWCRSRLSNLIFEGQTQFVWMYPDFPAPEIIFRCRTETICE